MSRRKRFAIVALSTIFATFVFTNPAMAYIGPGGGMEFLGYAMGLIAMLGAAFASFVLWPFYKFLGWLRGAKGPAPAEQSLPTISVADTSPPSSAIAPSEHGQPASSSPSVP